MSTEATSQSAIGGDGTSWVVGTTTLSPPAIQALQQAEGLRVWIRRQAAWYRALGTESALWLARHIEGLAEQADLLHADDPETFEDRLAVLAGPCGAVNPVPLDPPSQVAAGRALEPGVAEWVHDLQQEHPDAD